MPSNTTTDQPTLAVINRFWPKVQKGNGCWLWIAGLSNRGYGQFYGNRHAIPAHRFSYQLVKGQIPDGMMIDHTCRNRACVNPDHLRAVDARTNARENNVGPAAINAAKQTCRRGHPFNEQNTRVWKGRYQRQCILCQRERQTKFRDRVREARRG